MNLFLMQKSPPCFQGGDWGFRGKSYNPCLSTYSQNAINRLNIAKVKMQTTAVVKMQVFI
jgi:hypothetical protein